MDKVTTATGREFSTDYLVASTHTKMMFLRIIGETSETVREVFQNPEETATITYAGQDYEGFTTFCHIIDEGDALKVVLKHE